MPNRWSLLVLLIGGVTLAVILSMNGPAAQSGPPLTRDCTMPAIALSSKVTGAGAGIQYSITGPPRDTYVVAVDAAHVTINGDGVIATPKGAFGAAIRRGLRDCGFVGTLPTLQAGPHMVGLFRDGREVARASLGA